MGSRGRRLFSRIRASFYRSKCDPITLKAASNPKPPPPTLAPPWRVSIGVEGIRIQAMDRLWEEEFRHWPLGGMILLKDPSRKPSLGLGCGIVMGKGTGHRIASHFFCKLIVSPYEVPRESPREVPKLESSVWGGSM